MNEFQKLMSKDFKSTVKDWKHKPDFDEQDTVNDKRYTTEVSTINKIYFYVSHGTKIRYATMTSDFVSKTSPGRIPSRRGKGGVLFISRKRPRPGIKGRKFDTQIKKKREVTFSRIMKKNLKKLANEVNK